VQPFCLYQKLHLLFTADFQQLDFLQRFCNGPETVLLRLFLGWAFA